MEMNSNLNDFCFTLLLGLFQWIRNYRVGCVIWLAIMTVSVTKTNQISPSRIVGNISIFSLAKLLLQYIAQAHLSSVAIFFSADQNTDSLVRLIII